MTRSPKRALIERISFGLRRCVGTGRLPAVEFERPAKLRAELVRSKNSIDAVLDRRAAPEPPHLIW